MRHTIVALATPAGRGGLAVVRLSGPDALAVARRVFAGGPDLGDRSEPPRCIRYTGQPVDDNRSRQDHAIDQVLALPLLAPRSYTGEDTVEFFCHGGRVVARQAVAACRAAGAEPAPPPASSPAAPSSTAS